jgi:hypothetical protein
MYLLFIHHPYGFVQTMTFSSVWSRALAMIALGSQPVVLRIADPVVRS